MYYTFVIYVLTAGLTLLCTIIKQLKYCVVYQHVYLTDGDKKVNTIHHPSVCTIGMNPPVVRYGCSIASDHRVYGCIAITAFISTLGHSSDTACDEKRRSYHDTGTSPSKKKLCEKCKTAFATKQCSRCKNVWYCGRPCQLEDWKLHKSTCK